MRVWQMTLTKVDLVAACDGARLVAPLRKRRADRKAFPLITVAGPLGLSFRSSDATFDVNGRGDWSSPVQVAGAVLHTLAPLVAGPQVTLVYADRQLVIGTTVLPAVEV